MKTIYEALIVALALFVAFFVATDLTAKTATEIFQRTSPSIVVVRVYDETGKAVALGSGVVLPGGSVATNYHVVESAASIMVYQGNKGYRAVLLYRDRDRDVCSLLAQGMKAPAVGVGSTRALKVGARVYAIGTPEGLERTISEGIISGLRQVEGGQRLQITTAISPGSSGGGLFDEEGRLIGLTTSSIAEGQQLNFAVPVEWVTELPTRHEKASGAAETYVGWLNKAQILEEKKDWAGLIDHAFQRINSSPRDVSAWFALGIAYVGCGELDKSVEAYKQVVHLKPNYAHAWNNLGGAYLRLGRTAEAIDAYQQTIDIDPRDAMAWRNLGDAYDNAGQLERAIAAYERALRIEPDYFIAWYNVGNAYRKSGQNAKAIEAYEQVVRINSKFATGWLMLGSVCGVSGQFNRAIEAFRQAIQIDPESVDAWTLLGSVYVMSGHKERCPEVYEQLKKLDPAKAEEFFNKLCHH